MKITIVSYGGGTNSSAMLVGLWERGERPDYITFADTGSEKPHTYEHIAIMNDWCWLVGFPEIIILGPTQPQMVKDGSLHQQCLRLGTLPSKAYGLSGCTMKWKVDIQAKFNREIVKLLHLKLSDVTRLIGFDADEPSRVARGLRANESREVQEQYPLYDWGWGRDECVSAISRAGLPQPGKSACFMCPSSKKPEILELRDRYPDLFAIAIEMERGAFADEGEGSGGPSRCGLGRYFSWTEFVAEYDAGKITDFASPVPEADCGCYDGE